MRRYRPIAHNGAAKKATVPAVFRVDVVRWGFELKRHINLEPVLPCFLLHDQRSRLGQRSITP